MENDTNSNKQDAQQAPTSGPAARTPKDTVAYYLPQAQIDWIKARAGKLFTSDSAIAAQAIQYYIEAFESGAVR